MASNSDGSITIMFALPEQITGNNAGTAYTIKVGWSLMNTKEVDSPAADVAVTMVEFAFGTSSGVVWIPATVANAIVLSQDVVVPKNSTKKGAKVITVTAPNAPGGSTGVVLAVRTTTIFSPASNSPMTGQKTVE